MAVISTYVGGPTSEHTKMPGQSNSLTAVIRMKALFFDIYLLYQRSKGREMKMSLSVFMGTTVLFVVVVCFPAVTTHCG
jgi:hypothetical protein